MKELLNQRKNNVTWFYNAYDFDYSFRSKRTESRTKNGIARQKKKAKYYYRSVEETLKTAIE